MGSVIFNKRVFNPLLTAQITAHLSLFPMLFYAAPRHYLTALTVYFFTGCIGMSMTYHRLLAHGSYRAPRWFEVFGVFCAVLGLTGSSLTWCSVHREHHRLSDTSRDPHSPRFMKWWRVQFFSMLQPPKIKFMRHKLKDPLHRFAHKNYFLINFIYALFLYLWDPFAVIYAHLFPAALLWHSGSAVNTVGHLFGYRNFKTEDFSRNNPVLALLTWGEGWHNNHHHRPGKYYFGIRRYEMDIAGALISVLLFFRNGGGFMKKAKATAGDTD